MKYLSVCSGIEAATVAWHGLGWKPLAFSEIEKFPAAVLAHHYPNTPNLGDMTKFKEWENYAPDILVGGTPCQSFSVAGLRKGLDDPRGSLMLTYIAIADRYRPRWIVWENVPGVLSSNGGKDFGTFLGALGEIGYGFAYRVLDAQYFGVPQRRRRVFVVGHLGDWRRAAAVLFEQHSLSGNPAPSRKKGERVAPCLSQSLRSSGGIGMSNQELFSQGGGGLTWTGDDNQGQAGHLVALGFSNVSDGSSARNASDLSNPLTCRHGDPGMVVCMSTGQASAEIVIGIGATPNCNHEAPVVSYSMLTANTNANGLGVGKEIAPTLDRVQPCAVACFSAGQSSKAGSITYQIEQSPTLRSGASGTNMTPSLHNGSQVRSLTPVECERLQGFPDNYTNIPWRNKPEAPDGPRYKALGNSMAVPCMRWIGERINLVDLI